MYDPKHAKLYAVRFGEASVRNPLGAMPKLVRQKNMLSRCSSENKLEGKRKTTGNTAPLYKTVCEPKWKL